MNPLAAGQFLSPASRALILIGVRDPGLRSLPSLTRGYILPRLRRWWSHAAYFATCTLDMRA